MIEFNFDIDFKISNLDVLRDWIAKTVVSENKDLGQLSYTFCDDSFLHKLNVEFLNHDTFTDILTFDYGMGNEINGEIFISVDRVNENASLYQVTSENELHRVMVHGVFHLCGYKDESDEDQKLMRRKEDEALDQLSILISKQE